MANDSPASFGDRLRRLRMAAGLTQEALAEWRTFQLMQSALGVASLNAALAAGHTLTLEEAVRLASETKP